MDLIYSPREQMIRDVKRIGQFLMDNANVIVGEGEIYPTMNVLKIHAEISCEAALEISWAKETKYPVSQE